MTFSHFSPMVTINWQNQGGFSSLSGINSVLSQIAKKGGCNSEERMKVQQWSKNIWKIFSIEFLLFEASKK